MAHLRHDLRHAVRMMWRQPLASGLAILTLALGVGATTAIFSAIDATLLRPLPYAQPDRLVAPVIVEKGEARGVMLSTLFGVWRGQTTRLEALAAYRSTSWWLATRDEPVALEGVHASRELLAVLGVQPALGRGFLPEEEQPAAGPVVIVSDRLWRQQLGADPAILGRTVTLSDRPYTVVGVLPARFAFPGRDDVDLIAPLRLAAPDDARAMIWYLGAIGRMKPGVTPDAVRLELDALVRGIGDRAGARTAKMLAEATVRVPTLQQSLTSGVRGILLLLFGAVGCVLLIACANIANLQLARAMGRRREVAVRAALGAGRGRLIAQLLTESLLLAALGAACALPLAAIGIRLLRATPALAMPRPEQLALDGGVLLFSLLLAAVAAIVSGMAPALAVTGGSLGAALTSGSARTGETRSLARARSALLIAEIAAACMLLVGAGLLTRSLLALMSANTGFTADAASVQTLRVSPRSRRYQDDARRQAYYDELLAAARGVQGVRAAGLSSGLPLEGFMMAVPLRREDQPESAGEEAPPVPVDAVSDGYFGAMGIPLLAGRDFSTRDTETAPPVAIVNDTLARALFPDGRALGCRIQAGSDPPVTIVGIAGSVRQLGLQRPPDPAWFRPIAQLKPPSIVLVARAAAGDASTLTPALLAAVRRLDREQPVEDVQTMAAVRARQLAAPRANMRLLSLFALLAIGLAAIGLYGVMAHSVASRAREMGLRLALGARPADVRRLILAQGLRVGIVGVALGLGGAWLGARVIARFLYGVTPLDALTWSAVPLGVLAVLAVAAYGPARRAAATDPMAALRVE